MSFLKFALLYAGLRIGEEVLAITFGLDWRAKLPRKAPPATGGST